ncbi:DUF5074 domain-containing protein [Chitinophaga nivalis]|uniref:DUF5074 domain-containing protein n=1 Tax=Chitinophaga nivalis TaxID=2991709 RepID=A0ABT3ILI4_9BACT|nr:DUF5074 domain-containing protein [Chitinophaga nivalis]MCW3465472.1 DUF5074 domain-containing protein [Chitinophaga nivalis]MCW3484837.1 DUF5074 domain-containing protein [Chitinophaga nivalis]
MKRHVLSWMSALFLLTVVSCRKNEVPPSSPVSETATLRYNMAVGDSRLLQPAPGYPPGKNFNWTVNGEAAGHDAAYRFAAKERGDYRIVFTSGDQRNGVDSVVYQVKVTGKYENGFFMLHEGQYATNNGDMAYYSYDSNKVTQGVYKLENPLKNLGPTTATLQFATIFKGKMYMVVKVGGPMVVTDAYTMKETGRIATLPQDEGHAFLGIDSTRGLLSAADGIYRVSLSAPAIGAKVAGINSSAGDMLLSGNYIFTLTKDDGIVILQASNYSIVKKHAKGTIGFARTNDGAVWAAGDSALVRIDPVTLQITETKLPFKVTNAWAYLSWRSGSITAGKAGNVVYIAARKEAPGIGGMLEYGGTTVYRYIPGTPSSLSAPFITLPAGHYFYGSAVRYNDAKQELVVPTLGAEWGNSNNNRWLIYNANTGALKQTVQYTGYYFPALPVFH